MKICTNSFKITLASIIPSVTSPISDKIASESGSPYFAPDLGLSLQNSLFFKENKEKKKKNKHKLVSILSNWTVPAQWDP